MSRASLLLVFTLASLLLTGCPDEPGDPRTWQLVAEDLDEALLSISGTSADDVWAVGADRGRGPLVLHWDGARWERLETGTRGDLWWVHAVPGGPVFLAGENATVLRYEGGRFERMRTPGVARQTVFGLWAASADEAYAVGSSAGRSGFVWRWDGSAWTELRLPDDIVRRSDGEVPGLFKVWSAGDGTAWIVGGQGCWLRARGAELESVATPTERTLFTVHGAGDDVVAVGGAGNAVLLERRGEGAIVDRSPELAPLLQGVFVTPGGEAWATGQRGEIQRRRGGAWTRAEHGLALDVESLHAAWVDPEGGLWAVGGNVISARLDAGAIVRFGTPVPRYEPESETTDGGVGDGQTPVVTCPDAVVRAGEDGSIARRWDEQALAAIRRDIPRPGVHARNLFHVSVAMFDAWAAYDAVADGVLVRERRSASDVEAARREAISYAAYRVLVHRYEPAIGGDESVACFRAVMDALGYDPDDTSEDGDGARALGNRIGRSVIEASAGDGANEAADYADPVTYEPRNPVLRVDEAGVEVDDPAYWQPLDLAESVTQNGIPLASGTQVYIGSHWGEVVPFALTRASSDALYLDPGAPPGNGAEMRAWLVEVLRRTAELDHEDGVTIDISPGAIGDNTLGANDGDGHATNPVTGAPYAPTVVPRGDFGRVLAEFWADGPRSETPPGHWNVLANQVADAPALERRLFGEGAELDALEWDVKVYLALNGAVHDAAIAAWQVKRRFESARPITWIRWMAGLGQSSDPSGPAYHADGLPLVDGLVEVITEASAAPGERHAHLSPYVGEIAVRSWRGEPGDRASEVGGIAWMRGVEWAPYQRRTFVTPAFPGFVSGHSTFSRAGAEVLAALTGSAYFPGGLGEYVARANAYLVFEEGPSVDVRLQWATYYDAADQAGQSRIWGGIHIEPDDFVGRRMGRECGLAAVARARTFFDGTAVE